jgi:hypothetical protein
VNPYATPQFFGENKARPMLKGIAKAIVLIGIAAMADQYLTNGTYTDAALSILGQIEAI